MPGLIPQDFIENLLSRTDIVEVVGERVSLRKTGHNHIGLCPFHNEKTPSFSVSEDKQFYYCFGCQESGNALRFVMETQNLDFVEAIEYLAQRMGLDVPREESSSSRADQARQEKQKSIYDVLGQANEYYKQQLRDHADKNRAVDYLKGRGLSGHIARDFDVGYAPPGGDNLRKALAISNENTRLLVESGLLIDLQDEKRAYDRFRDRIMFPIKDLRGRVVGFGGRILGEGKPKYLNSPETAVFHKGRELYGLYEARRYNRDLSSLIVVEGYLDVISLSQHGIRNVVATLGTATTKEHLERLYRMVPEIIFCFDGDNAGRKAAWKALEEAIPLLRDGRLARFLFLPESEDPDTLVRRQGADKFLHLLDKALFTPDFFFQKLMEETRVDSFEGKAALSKIAMPMIEKIPRGVFRQLMIERLASEVNLSVDKLLELAGSGEAEKPVVSASGQGGGGWKRTEKHIDSSRPMIETALVKLLRQPELASLVDQDVYERLAALPECKLLQDIANRVNTNDSISPVDLLSAFEGSSHYSYLKKLSETELLLPVNAWPAEFMGEINRLLAHLDKEAARQVREGLGNKALSEMSSDERQVYRNSVHNNRPLPDSS